MVFEINNLRIALNSNCNHVLTFYNIKNLQVRNFYNLKFNKCNLININMLIFRKKCRQNLTKTIFKANFNQINNQSNFKRLIKANKFQID